LGNPPSVEYRTSHARASGRFADAEEGRHDSRRDHDGRSRAKARPRGGRRGRTTDTGRTKAAGRAQAAQRRSPRRRRGGVVVPVAVVATFAVAAASGTAYLLHGHHHGTGGTAAFEAIQNSNTLTLLEAERRQLVDMNAATQVLAAVAKPLVVSPSQVQSNASSSSSTSGGTVVWATPDPAAAQATAKSMLASYGWNTSSQWSCLLSLWNRESGWVYDAENTASGAYGIPQALPASKMASAGSDYLTNPATQIKWGLGYIQGRYGTPCGAWNFELGNGFY
jgi:Transglycosylase SLT domain